MKLVKEDLANGRIIVIPQDSDDLYVLYNIITPGDIIRSKTSRRIKRGEGGTEGSSRLLVSIKLKAENIEFQGFGDIIRVRGKILEASDSHVTLGNYHTIKIELLKKISIKKYKWSSIDLEKIRAAQLGTPSGLVLIAIDDESALVSQVGTYATRILLELSPSIPRKGSDPKQHVKETLNFFADLSKFINKQRDEGIAEHIIIGGPGFTREKYLEYLYNNYPQISGNILSVATNSAGRPGIREIISDHIPENYISGNIAKLQSTLIQRCMEELGKDSGLVAYGQDVYYAAEIGAIEYLLVLDTELRGSIAKREKVQQLMEYVKKIRGKTITMSSMHEETGTILKGLGGIAALLRFKLPKK